MKIFSTYIYQIFKYLNILFFLFAFLTGLAYAIAQLGLILPLFLIGLPFGCFFLYIILKNPRYGIISSFIIAFTFLGITLYIDAPLGLALDAVLVITLFGALITLKGKEWNRANNTLVYLMGLWLFYCILQFFNPLSISSVAWFYAIRGVAFYSFISILLGFLVFNKKKDFNIFILIWLIGGIVSGLYGAKQLLIGLNQAELAWLAEGAEKTHVLFGRLRVFSFFSDAGQFGVVQAHTALVATILAVKPESAWKRFFYIFTAIICFYGMSISGTRGAIFVPLIGFLVYFVLVRNFKVLFIGLIFLGSFFCMLKFTFIGQGNYQIQRMRSALDPNDPSLQVRLDNQERLKFYMVDKPFGGGIGAAGYWGQRFTPGTFLAETPPDSHFVRIWMETGIVGLYLHIATFLIPLLIAFVKIVKIKNDLIRQQMIALAAGIVGVLVASYGNQVLSQMPTNMFFYISFSFLFIGPEWDKNVESFDASPDNIS